MTIPYAPSQLSLPNFDASQQAVASWKFASPDVVALQASFEIQIYNNSTGALVLDTTVTTSTPLYQLPPYTLVNRTMYKWQVRYTDTAGNTSPWSQFQVFTCSSAPVAAITSLTPGQTVASNTVTIVASYLQDQNIQQQSYRIVLYGTDQKTVVQDSGTLYGTTNQLTCTGLANGTYFAQAMVTSSDGLSGSTGLIMFTVAYSGGTQSPSISTTPLPAQAGIRIDWHNPKSNLGNYVGSGPVYKAAKYGSGLSLASFGEKIFWTHKSLTQFTYTSWFVANQNSWDMASNQIIAYLQADAQNFIQLRYDPMSHNFVLDLVVGGQAISAKNDGTSPSFFAGNQIFVALRQTSSELTAFIAINNHWEKYHWHSITLPPLTGSPSVYGTSSYAEATYNSSISGVLKNITRTYIGCSPTDGDEFNAILDQTHLTTNIMSDSDIQAIYFGDAQQQYSTETVFLANFEQSLEGGDAGPIPIARWQVIRSFGGVQTLLGTVENNGQATASYTDLTPLSGFDYQYIVVPIDVLGGQGSAQVASGSVQFDGWWLTDTSTGQSFQIVLMVQDVPIKRNYQRAETQTNGQYPIVSYGSGKWRTGEISGWLVGANNPQTAFQQYQSLETLIDSHRPLYLRGDEGWGMRVDCHDLENNIPHRNHQQYNVVKFQFTEVANL